MKHIPSIIAETKATSRSKRVSALKRFGVYLSSNEAETLSEENRDKIFNALFESVSDVDHQCRAVAVQKLGLLAKNKLLNNEQQQKLSRCVASLLGYDDFEWDSAFIVRKEAERVYRLVNENAKPAQFQILEKRELCPQTFLYQIYAPQIARKIEAGQFIIVRVEERGERIPLSISGWEREGGTIRIIVMSAGRTSADLNDLEVGDCLQDVVGPLGTRSHLVEGDGSCVVIGGGYGTGAIIPTAIDARKMGKRTIGIVGARSEDLVIMEEELRDACDEVFVTTNDGSKGIQGFVTNALEEILKNEKVDMVLAVGPVPMMRAVADMTREKKIPTWVSLNAIMVDGTGMCGACRVTVGGETRFACIDGPDFDGHLVDYDELTKRQRMFVSKEQVAMEQRCVREGKA